MSSKGKRVKNKSEKTMQQIIADYALEVIVGLYVFVMLVVYPVYYEDKYFNMGAAKFNFYGNVTIVFMAILIVAFIGWILAYKNTWSFSKVFRSYSVTDWFVVAFFLSSYISWLVSANKDMAFNGYNDWNMGLMAQTMFVLTYFFVSRFWKKNNGIIISGIAIGAWICLLAVLMRFGFDPLKMYEGVSDKDIEKFVSTLGQTSWYSSYAVLIYIPGMFWYYRDDRIWARIVSGLFVLIGAASIVTVNSDSAFVALALIFMVFAWYGFENNKNFSRLLELAVIVFTAFRIVGLFQDWFPERRITHVADTEAICEFFNHSQISLIIWCTLIVALLVYRILLWLSYDNVRKEYSFDISKYKACRKGMVVAAIVLLYLVVLTIILTTTGRLPEGVGSSVFAKIGRPFDGKELFTGSGFFNFVDAWGNHRGFNWRMAVQAIANAKPVNVMFGVGPDCFALAMDSYCAAEVAQYWHMQTLACAHNEFLNMAVTEGIFGAVTYLGIMISSASRLAKCAYKNPRAIVCFAIILAYIGHNFFCYQTCVSTPFVFIAMGIGESMIRQQTNSMGNEA